MDIFIQVTAAVLAVFGAYSAMKLIGETFFPVRGVTAAVLVTSEAELHDLDILLREAERRTPQKRGQPPVVLIDRALLRTDCMGCADRADCMGVLPDAAAQIAAHGARWFPADLTDGGTESKQ